MSEVVRSVGRYEIERELGRGGMARVFLARQTDLDRLVALKELSAFHASDPQFAQRFLRESRLAGSLSHPNIVTVHEYFEHEGTPYIAMEYVPRGSLRPYVGRLSLAQVVGVLEGMLAGLTHAESKGVVHRDLKPENLMVTDEGRVKIADFGIAKATAGAATGAFMTATGTTVGTPAYMAPEQAMAQDIGPWTDLYSVGMMAYEMLVGRLPFADTDAPMVLLMKQVNEPVPPPRQVNPDLDEDLGTWIEGLVEKDPAKRPQTAADAWDELEESVIRIFGARWRREARLPATAAAADAPSPLTPAPFDGTIGPDLDAPAAEESDEFQSFAWNKPAAAAPVAPVPEAPAPEPVVEETPVVEEAAPAVVEDVPEEQPVAEPTPTPVAEVAAPEVEEAPEVVEAPEAEEAPEAAEPMGEEPPAAAAVETPVDPFKTYGPRRPPPPPEPPPEPVVEAEPEPEPEPEELGATIAPSRMPEPEPVAEVAPRAEAAKPGGRRVWWFVAGAVVVAAAIGFLVAPSSKKKASQPATLASSASSGGIQVGFPAAWRHAAAAPAVAGLPLKTPTAITGPTAGETVLAGMSNASGPTLLPQSFLARLPGAPHPVAVKLGAVNAYRYTGLSASNPAQRMTAYVVPTDRGVATIACVGSAAAAPECEQIATSLQLQGPRAFPLGPSASYAQALGGALTKLNTAAGKARGQLATAKTPTGQASAAQALSGAYRSAAAKLRGLSVSPADAGANAALTTALAAAGRDYAALSSAAKHSNKKAYARAASAAKRDEARAAAAVSGLRSLGYTTS